MHQRFRAAAAAANRQTIAVALEELDLLKRNAELFAQYLRKGRGVAHAEIERAGCERHCTVGVEAISASSFDGGAVTSKKLPMPSPRSLPRLRLSRLRRESP